jgi:hypothetical protein
VLRSYMEFALATKFQAIIYLGKEQIRWRAAEV